ncbi:MAG: adenosylmethionine decarboxylase [Patescibacteria group bacterium]|nr:adenosylmethionine decarboxylase [Patescibacteria group bacterium]
MIILGAHALLDLYGCNSKKINNQKTVLAAMLDIVNSLEMKVIGKPFVHKFHPQGCTAFIPLAESHLAIHTWPERGFAALDIFTCGQNRNFNKIIKLIKRKLDAQRTKIKITSRGVVRDSF